MNQNKLKYCFRGILGAVCFLTAIDASGQTDSKWWKRDVKNDADSVTVETKIDSMVVADSVKIYPFPISERMGVLVINADSAITAIDGEWKAAEKTLSGYRIQIHFGNLESARAIRAKCRKEMELDRIYLESIAPNYSVAVGDYRTRWEAELALGDLKKHYPDALLVPSEINLPDLD